ncbi:MAG TPA: M12 family metallo-peptidase [Thermoanaerobaculia bacterium]
MIRRALLAVLSLCLATMAAADSHHPHIMKSEVVSLDAGTIERNANSGTPFELVLGGLPLTLVVSPAPVWPAEGLIVLEVDGDDIKKRIVTGNITYAGEVAGEDPDASEVRFSITSEGLEGYVLSETGWWFVEPLSHFDPKAKPDLHLVYATRDLDFVLPYGDDGVKADEVIDYEGGIGGNKDGKIPLLMVADHQYITRSGALPFEARHATLINMVNGIYKTETWREFRVVASIGDFGNNRLTTTNGQNLLTALKPFVNFAAGLGINAPSGAGLKVLNSFFAHLTTAKDLDGVTMGVADEPGTFGLSQQSVPPVGGSTTALAFQNMMIAAHEIGHNWFAMHDKADCICVDEGLFGIGCWDYRRTIMWHEFISDHLPRFSNGEQDSSHNNKMKIRDFMATKNFF